MPYEDDGDREPVDLSSIPRKSGLTLYGSTKLERNSKSVNAQSTAYVIYSPPEDMPINMALEFFTQVQQAVTTSSWKRAEERRIAIETGHDDAIEQFEVNLVGVKPTKAAIASRVRQRVVDPHFNSEDASEFSVASDYADENY